MRLTETERIEILIMIGYGDKTRTQEEVCRLFNSKHPNRVPITRSTVSKVEKKFRENGHVKDLPKSGRPKVSEETKQNVLLAVQDNPNITTRQIGHDNNIHHTTVFKILKKEKSH